MKLQGIFSTKVKLASILIAISCIALFSPVSSFAHWEYFYGYPIWVNDAPQLLQNVRANFEYFANSDGTYDVLANWTDPDPTIYSIGLTQYSGTDPGPNADTIYAKSWVFHNISPGTWYFNMKKSINGYWSQVGYWTVTVPTWVAPSETPTPTVSETNLTSDISTSNTLHNFIFYTELALILFFIYSLGKYIYSKGKNNKKDISKYKKFWIISLIAFFGVLILSPKVALNGDGTVNLRCSRAQPYSMAPEFSRAISLVGERLVQAYGPGTDNKGTIQNCLDIQYSDLNNGEEGYFTFDKNSTKDDLKIYVSNSYKEYDDILTAILLSHEITHALQFVNNEGKSCLDSEVEAFMTEYYFMKSLNPEEKSSLATRLGTNPTKNTAYEGIYALMDFGKTATTNDELKELISIMVKSNPYYQQECNLTSN